MILEGIRVLDFSASNDVWIRGDEHTGVPYMVTHSHWEGVKPSRRRIPDREAGALRRVQKLLASHADLWFYQGIRTVGAGRAAGFTNLIPFLVIDMIVHRMREADAAHGVLLDGAGQPEGR